MTITLNTPYATFSAGASVDLDYATEAALVAQARAVYTVNPGSVFTPLTATEQQTLRKNAVATQALVSGFGKPPNCVASWSPGSGSTPWTNDGSAGTTWQTQFAHRGKPYAFQIGYFNPTTSAYTVDKTTVTPSATFAINGDPTGTPVNILFGGSAPAVVPAAAANNQEFVLSDWTAIAPLPRTDVVTAYNLTHVRSYISLANHPFGYPNGNTVAYPGNSVTGLIRNSGFQIADKIASPAGFASNGGVSGYHLPIIINTRSLARVCRVLSVGDSLTGGQAAPDGGEYYSVVERACNVLNNQTVSSSRFYSHSNLGCSGQTFAQFTARTPKILTSITTDVWVMPVWSPNSAIASQSAFDSAMAQLLEVIDRVRQAGAAVVLWTSPPSIFLSAADDAWRKLSNTAAKTLASNGFFSVADLDVLVSDQQSPARWQTGLSDDGLHWNGIGSNLVAPTLAAAIGAAAKP